MEQDTAITVRLLAHLLNHIEAFTTHHAYSLSYLSSLTNITAQRQETKSFHSASGYANPTTTPLILQEFPDLVPKLLAKQTLEISKMARLLHDELREMQDVVDQMETLTEEGFEALQSTQGGRNENRNPAGIPLVEAVSWLEEITVMYKQEMGMKANMLHILDTGCDSDKLQKMKTSWEALECVDLAKETEIRERLHLFKVLGKVVQ
ncbi:hypothetical protein HDU85_007806 [Gaertneriomyces sp. JEL0708]|nr:hypothetical protein HDU85_007806 [Gaertneriomyces sp. JEL0708]